MFWRIRSWLQQNFRQFYFLLAGLGFIFFIIFMLTSSNGLFRLYALDQMRTKMEKENLELKEKKLKAIIELQSLNDLKVIENLARQRLGFVYPDEVVYVEGE